MGFCQICLSRRRRRRSRINEALYILWGLTAPCHRTCTSTSRSLMRSLTASVVEVKLRVRLCRPRTEFLTSHSRTPDMVPMIEGGGSKTAADVDIRVLGRL
jgi:hypothetical protein